MNRVRAFLVVAACAAVTGCSTLAPLTDGLGPKSDVPEESLRQAAVQIESAVASGNRDVARQDVDGLVINTEDIVQAVRTRAARQSLVSGFLDTGHAWERRDGQLWIIRSSAYKKFGTRKDRDRHALMINGETADRWIIYEQIRRENNMPRGSLDILQRVFFEERVKLMQPGQKYEIESGKAARVGGEN
jgi:hypothetical protein